jgi:hypothetical protein
MAAATCSRWFLARGFFYPEDGGDTFLRNVGSQKSTQRRVPEDILNIISLKITDPAMMQLFKLRLKFLINQLHETKLFVRYR